MRWQYFLAPHMQHATVLTRMICHERIIVIVYDDIIQLSFVTIYVL